MIFFFETWCIIWDSKPNPSIVISIFFKESFFIAFKPLWASDKLILLSLFVNITTIDKAIFLINGMFALFLINLLPNIISSSHKIISLAKALASSIECWPSASKVTTASALFKSWIYLNPVDIAAPCPKLIEWFKTVTSKDSSISCEASDEPSFTTIIFLNTFCNSETTLLIFFSSLNTGTNIWILSNIPRLYRYN